MSAPFSQEFQHLLSILSGDRPEIPERLNPDQMISLMKRHKIAAQAASLMHMAEYPVPITAWMQRYLQINAQTALLTAGLLAILLDALAAHGIEAIPFKGIVLSQQLFNDPGCRTAGDIDLFIRKQDVLSATRILGDSGFTTAITPRDYQRRLRGRHHVELVNQKGLYLELHWMLTGKDWSIPYDFDALLKRTSRLQIADYPVRVFSPEDLLILLCIHGGRHLWYRLCWVVDVHQLVMMSPQMNWQEVLLRAKQSCSLRLLLVGLSVSASLLRTPLPSSIKSLLAEDEAAQSIVTDILADIEQAHKEQLVDHIRLRENLIHRLRYWLIRVIPEEIKLIVESTESIETKAWAMQYPTPLNYALRLTSWVRHRRVEALHLLGGLTRSQMQVFKRDVLFVQSAKGR